jgi:hypothetical protein
MKKVILSSFHSCSLHALECEGVEPDRILSFDSHIDTNLLGVLEEVLSMIRNDRSLRYAFTDGGTHALIIDDTRKWILGPYRSCIDYINTF